MIRITRRTPRGLFTSLLKATWPVDISHGEQPRGRVPVQRIRYPPLRVPFVTSQQLFWPSEPEVRQCASQLFKANYDNRIFHWAPEGWQAGPFNADLESGDRLLKKGSASLAWFPDHTSAVGLPDHHASIFPQRDEYGLHISVEYEHIEDKFYFDMNCTLLSSTGDFRRGYHPVAADWQLLDRRPRCPDWVHEVSAGFLSRLRSLRIAGHTGIPVWSDS